MMKQTIKSPRYRVEAVDVNTVDADTLFAVAEYYDFPPINLSYPDYSKYVDITPTRSIKRKREAWEHLVRYLEHEKPLGTDMYKYTFLKLYDWEALLEKDPLDRPSVVSRMFNDRPYLVLAEADKLFSVYTNLAMCPYYRVCLLLTRAEILNFPEFTIPYYNYTINGDMESWLKFAKWFYLDRDDALVWATQRLMEWIESGIPPAPKKYKYPIEESTDVTGSSTVVLIEKMGALKIWKSKQPIGSL